MARAGNPLWSSSRSGGRSNPLWSSSGGGARAQTGAGRLNQAVTRAGETGDSGLLGFAKDIAGKATRTAGNAVMRALDVADVGRAAVVSAGVELTDLLSGGQGRIEDTDRVQQTGLSFDDWWENTKNRVGFGDVLEADPVTRDSNIWVKRALGFTGDVAADPLTYLTFGASQIPKAGAAGSRAALSTDDVARRLVRAGDTANAERVLAGRSAAAAPREALERVGVDRGAVFANRWRVRPLDGISDVTSRAFGRTRRKAADLIGNKVSDDLWSKFERVPGTRQIRNNPRFQQEGTANVKALEWVLGWRDSGITARNLRRQYADQLNDLAGKYGADPENRRAIVRALESGGGIVPGAEEFRSFFDNIVGDIEQATGIQMPTLQNYVSHVLTPEAREALRRPGRRSGSRAASFLQHRGREGTIEEINEQFIADAYDASRAKFGPKVDKLFNDDIFEIANSYLNQVERFVRTRAFEKSIADAGLADFFNEASVRKVLKGNQRRLKRAAKASAKQERAQAQADRRGQQARAVEGIIARRPFTGEAAGQADDLGVELGQQEELVDDLARQDEEINEELAQLAEERQALEAAEADALPEDPRSTVETAEAERTELEAGRQQALAEQEAAQGEVAQLSEQQGGLRQAAEQVSTERVVDRLDRIVAEAETRGLEPQKVDFLKNLARKERGQVPRGDWTRERIEGIATKMEEALGLRQAATDADLASRIAAAKRRVNAAGARAKRAEKAIAKRLKVIEEAQPILETEYAIRGDMTPLIEENRTRITELAGEQKRVSRELRRARQAELSMRRRFEQLAAQAAEETDPRLKLHANLEAQAQLAQAEAVRHGWVAQDNVRGLRHVSARDYELASLAADDQIVKINAQANLWADPETAEAFIRLKESLSPDNIKGILKLHDRLMSRWKAYALLSPGYHARNLYGGMFMNDVAGYDGGAQGYLRYASFARNLRKHGPEVALGRIKDPQIRAAYTTLWENRGAVLQGAVGQDLADVLSGAPGRGGVLQAVGERVGREGLGRVRGTNLDPTALDFGPLSANRRVAESAEHLLRGPLYVDGLLKGLSPEEAYDRVIRFHFDYSEGLSEFERRVMRRVIPFYTWTRLNFPIQLEYMMRNPGIYSKYNHAVQNLEMGTEEETYVPSWITELGGFRAPATYGGDRLYVSPDLPHLRVGQMFDTDQLLSQLSPAIKTPMELRSGERFFSNVPFKDEYTPVPTAWLPLAPFLEAAGGKLGLPQVTREGTNYFFNDEGELYKAEQFLPLLGRMRRLVPNTETDQENAFRSWLSFGLGLNVLRNTPRQQENEMFRRAYEIEDLVDAWNKRNELAEAA